jgi:hypothetical protein
MFKKQTKTHKLFFDIIIKKVRQGSAIQSVIVVLVEKKDFSAL